MYISSNHWLFVCVVGFTLLEVNQDDLMFLMEFKDLNCIGFSPVYPSSSPLVSHVSNIVLII